MKSSTKDKTVGKAHEVKGAVKEVVGKTIHNKDMETSGFLEKVGGKAQNTLGKIEKKLGK